MLIDLPDLRHTALAPRTAEEPLVIRTGSGFTVMPTPMDREAADRISTAAERDPNSPTAQSGFDGPSGGRPQRRRGRLIPP